VDGELDVVGVVDGQGRQRVLTESDDQVAGRDEVAGLLRVDVALVGVPVRTVVLDGEPAIAGEVTMMSTVQELRRTKASWRTVRPDAAAPKTRCAAA
jgi:hypothetical protein